MFKCRPALSAFYRYQHAVASQIQRVPFRILFMGRDEFSCLVLKELHGASDLWQNLAIATQPDRHVGRRGSQFSVSPLKVLGESLSLPVYTIPTSKAEFRQWKLPSPFSDEHPHPPQNHLIVTASFGRILPTSFLDLFLPHRRLNVHPSLLPAYRGPAPIQHAIMNGDTETGVCIIQMLERKAGIDAGAVYGCSRLEMPQDIDFAGLRDELAIKGGKLLVSVLRDMLAGRTDSTEQRTAEHVSTAPVITSADSMIDFENMTAESIVRRHRAIAHQRPLTAFLETGKSVQLHHQAVHPLFASEYLLFSPGATRYDTQAGALLIRCADDTVLSVLGVKQEGKSLIAAKEWWNGVKGLGLVDADQIQLAGKPTSN
ncbi:hypothetical protein APHAL10511_006722 [Amanita phalloides]|nr:hypothetical protein APHAL10511_006722 [Amanita phalloides]